jgi:hypothetical protein
MWQRRDEYYGPHWATTGGGGGSENGSLLNPTLQYGRSEMGWVTQSSWLSLT